MPRILILTASMGEGHNTAARNIKAAIEVESGGKAEVLVADPYSRTNPLVNRLVQRGYTLAINRYPRAWKLVFDLLSKPGVVEGMGPMLAELKAAVRAMCREFTPDLIVSTYPIYAFLVAKLRRQGTSLPPLVTVITDSTMINSAWFRWLCDGFFVADDATAQVLRAGRVPEDLITVTGFPVNAAFDKQAAAAHPGRGPWKVLLFPGGRSERAISTIQRLETIANIEVTVVAGRRQRLHNKLKSMGLPSAGNLFAWTDDMPGLMAAHHFFVGKAGGATVQEAIAARLPFVVSHVVPGQEEGNIALIERAGIGALASTSSSRVGDVIEGAIAGDGILWRAWRENITRISRPSAALAIARNLLSRAGVVERLAAESAAH